MSYPPTLARDFYQRTTEVVARELLGKLLVRTHPDGVTVLRLTEVEAYLGVDDPACHTFGGRRTARTETMWGEAGHAYIYLVYGLHNCLNVVTVGPEWPEAVLVRGGAVVGGMDLVRERRGPRIGERSLTNGPGKLCQALAITLADDGVDLCSPARTSHQLPAAAVDAPHPAVFSHFGVLDVLSSTTPRPSGRKPHWARHLADLATKAGERCGLESTLRICDDGVEIPENRVRRVPRVGVDYAGEAASWPLRLVTDSIV